MVFTKNDGNPIDGGSTGYTITINTEGTPGTPWSLTVVRNGQTETISSGTQITNVTQITEIGGEITGFNIDETFYDSSNLPLTLSENVVVALSSK